MSEAAHGGLRGAVPAVRSSVTGDALPTGTVTFLFADVEGSTRLVATHGAEEWARLLLGLRTSLNEAAVRRDGVEFGAEGDGFFFAFRRASDAVAAAAVAQQALQAVGGVAMRMAVHTGEPLLTPAGYVGEDLHKVARICAAGHGGQVLISEETLRLVGEGIGVTELGQYRLRGFDAPVRLFQLGDERFPPLRTAPAGGLPAQATPLVGRERELAELAGLLNRAEVRLLTLVGPGGVGKTRLAHALALRSRDRFDGGVFWVPLQAVRDSTEVLPAVADAMGAEGLLHGHLGDRPVLVVLDNFEQVAAAASDVVAVFGGTPNAKVLVTSREALRVTGEHRFLVEPLRAEEAAALFTERARAVAPSFRPTGALAAVVQRLDRLPLAIELAAARLSAVTVEEMLDRMDRRLPILGAGPRDAPERQQTLAATLTWSYELLGELERRLFGRLSVFAGGFELEAAERVCQADLDTLQALVEKSLVTRLGSGRLDMLATIRAYAAERLCDSGEADELGERHAAWALDLAERAGRALLTGEGQEEWLARLAGERANLLAAGDWLTQAHDGEQRLRLAIAVSRAWEILGPIDEGRRWLEGALATAPVESSVLRGVALRRLARFALTAGDLVAARQAAEESVEILRRTPESREYAAALNELANTLSATGEPEQAHVLYQEALELFRRADDEAGIGGALGNLGYLALSQGDAARAVELLREGLEWRSALDVQHSRLHNLALAHLALGQQEEARRLLAESLKVAAAIPQDEGIAYVLAGMGVLAAEEHDYRRAVTLLACADSLFDLIGVRPNPYEGELACRARSALRARIGGDRFEMLWKQGAALSVAEAVAYALKGLEALSRERTGR